MTAKGRTRRRDDATAWHQALFYADDHEYLGGVRRFIDTALAWDEPVFVAAPAAHVDLVQQSLNGAEHRVRFADMAQLGRNPGRIIPAIRAFVDTHADQPVSFVGEPIWAGRTPAEIAEATRHEALINAAFDGCSARVLCPYDVTGLAQSVLADAHRTHPELVDAAGTIRASGRYVDPATVWADTVALSPVPVHAYRMAIADTSLVVCRELAARLGVDAGLAPERVDELVIVVSELTSNSVRHAGGTAELTVWTEADRVVCEVVDRGRITDPLVGRRQPSAADLSGRGLYLVNHLCDLVQLHSDVDGTRVRVAMLRPST